MLKNNYEVYLIKATLLFQLLILEYILLLPEYIAELFPYPLNSRSEIGAQIIGINWLLNAKLDSIPEEAREHYILTGKVLIALIGLAVVGETMTFI